VRGWELAGAVGRGALIGGLSGVAALGAGQLLGGWLGGSLGARLGTAALAQTAGNLTQQLGEIWLECRTELDYWELLASSSIGVASYGSGRLWHWWMSNRRIPGGLQLALGLEQGGKLQQWAAVRGYTSFVNPPLSFDPRVTSREGLIQLMEEANGLHFRLEGYRLIGKEGLLEYWRTGGRYQAGISTNWEVDYFLRHPNLWPKLRNPWIDRRLPR
jgi:hypothetical protein